MKPTATAAHYAPPLSPELSASGVTQLIAIAYQERGVKNTDFAGDVLKAETRKAGVDISTFAGKTFYAENGTGVFVSSQPIGSGNRTAIAVRAPGGKMRIVTGCFRGTPAQLLENSDKNHGVGSPHNIQYREFLAEAFQKLPRAEGQKPQRAHIKFQPVQSTATPI